jgi:hypothetical protein
VKIRAKPPLAPAAPQERALVPYSPAASQKLRRRTLGQQQALEDGAVDPADNCYGPDPEYLQLPLPEVEREVLRIQQQQRAAGDLEVELLGASPLRPGGSEPRRSRPAPLSLRLVPADAGGNPGMGKRATGRRGRPPEIIIAPSDEESDAPSMSGASGRVTSPMSRRSWLEFSTPPTSETAATSRKAPGPLELLAAKEAAEAGEQDERSMWLEGLASRDMEFHKDDGPASARSRGSQRSSNASHARSVGAKSQMSAKSAGASEAETVASKSDFFGRLANKIARSAKGMRLRQKKHRPGSASGGSDEEGGWSSENLSDVDADDQPLNLEGSARFVPSVGVCPEEDNDEDDFRGNKNGERIVAAFIKMHPEYATEMRMDTAIKAFNLSIRDMADHIEAFELVAKGKGYITWRDIRSTMESTLQHKVSEGEAKALVQGVTGSAGRPMNLFDFIRFATTSSTNFMYSVQPVVLHL